MSELMKTHRRPVNGDRHEVAIGRKSLQSGDKPHVSHSSLTSTREEQRMDVKELGRLIGAKSGKAEYLPVAFLLKTGYACYGHYNSSLNDGLSDLCVLLNVRILDLSQSTQKTKSTVRDFSDFLEDVVVRASKSDPDSTDEGDDTLARSKFGKAIPIAAVVSTTSRSSTPLRKLVHSCVARGRKHSPRHRSPHPPVRCSTSTRARVLAVLRMKLW